MFQESEGTSPVVNKNTVDRVFIERFIKAMIRLPKEVRLRFKSVNKLPSIKVTIIYNNIIREELSSLANESLINAIIKAMGSSLKSIQELKSEDELTVEEISTDNFEQEMFERFIKSNHRLAIGEDFISPKGDRFLHAVLSIGYKRDIHFYLKRDESIEKSLNELMTA
nr:hypothetical protein [uncultured Bacteroides sp.]